MSTETKSKGPAQDYIASQRQMRALMSSILRDKIEQEASGVSRQHVARDPGTNNRDRDSAYFQDSGNGVPIPVLVVFVNPSLFP